MINKTTIAKKYNINPNMSYYAIKNPLMDLKKKKIKGLKEVIVEYQVKEINKDKIIFKKIKNKKSKSFPKLINFDIRLPNAEDEIIEKDKSYALFTSKDVAYFEHYNRLYLIASEISNLLSSEDNKNYISNDLKTDIETLKILFNIIKNTNCQSKLEEIELMHPELAFR